MKKALTITLTVVNLLFSACSTAPRSIRPMPEYGVDSTPSKLQEGVVAAVSKMKKSWVSVEPSDAGKLKDYGFAFSVSVFNGGLGPFNFGPESIEVHQEQKALKVLDGDGIRNAAKEKANGWNAAIVMSMVFDSLMSVKGYKAGDTTALANSNARNMDTAKQGAALNELILEESRAASDQYNKILLTSKLVDPFKTHGGFFLVKDYRPSTPLELRISAGQETHIIHLVSD